MSERPPVVYLDTQDYSRFGRVIEGRADARDEQLYIRLMAQADAGDVIFACSMPLLSELYSYDEALPQITRAKAEAVHALCRGYALRDPSTVLAIEIERLAYQERLVSSIAPRDVLSASYQWHPDVRGSLDDMKERIVEGARQQIAGLSRKARRAMDKSLSNINWDEMAEGAIPEMSAKYGLSANDIRSSLGLLLRDKISSEEASSRLFSSVANPVNFVTAYFCGFDGEKTLPQLIRGAGATLAGHLNKFKDAILGAYPRNEAEKAALRDLLSKSAPHYGGTMLGLVDLDGEQYIAIPRDTARQIRDDETMLAKLAAPAMLGPIISAYLSQIVALTGDMPKVEDSFAGDLIHSIYIPHVDLWRGDRRFCHLVKSAVPTQAGKLISRRGELPSAIEELNLSRRDSVR